MEGHEKKQRLTPLNPASDGRFQGPGGPHALHARGPRVRIPPSPPSRIWSGVSRFCPLQNPPKKQGLTPLTVPENRDKAKVFSGRMPHDHAKVSRYYQVNTR